MNEKLKLSEFVKTRRKSVKLTQVQLALKAGVGLRLLRDIEQGKENLQLNKVNQVLSLFGYGMAPVSVKPKGEV